MKWSVCAECMVFRWAIVTFATIGVGNVGCGKDKAYPNKGDVSATKEMVTETTDERHIAPPGGGVLAIVATLNNAISRMEATKPQDPEVFLGQPISPARETCMGAVQALRELARQEPHPPPDPQTPGDIIHFLLVVEQREDFRPAGWETQWVDWVQHGVPFVREASVFHAPCPLPESLRQQYLTGLRTLIATSPEPSVIHQAAEVALDRKIPRDELLRMLVDRIDSTALFRFIHVFLGEILKNGKLGRLHWVCVGVPDEAQVASSKAVWKRFLDENVQTLREGRPYRLDDIDTVPGMQLPSRKESGASLISQ